MRYVHFYAISVAVVLTAAVGFVLSSDPEARAEFEGVDQITAIGTPVAVETTTTAFDLVIGPEDENELVLSSAEIALTAEIAVRSTSTTSTTTTAPAAKATKATPKSSKPKSPNPTSPPATSPPSTIKAEYRPDYESEFRSLINSYRSANGLAGLSSDGDLNGRARWWAKAMAQEYGLSHSNLSSLVPPWSGAAENVGRGGSASGIFGMLKDSTGHRANMLGDYTHFGIGVWIDSNGTLWTAHVFTR